MHPDLRNPLLRFLLLCLLHTTALSAVAADRVFDVTRSGPAAVSLTEYFGILEDPGLSMSLEDVRQADQARRFVGDQRPGYSLDFGVTRSAWWLKLKLANTGDAPIESVLEMSYPRLAAWVDIYVPDAANGYRKFETGYQRPFSARPYKHHFYVLPLRLAPQTQQVIYMRFQSPIRLEIPARLWTREAFQDYERADYLSQAAYFGMVLAMAAFNLLLFVSLRDSNYLLYVAFIVAAALSFAANNGLAIEFLWGDSPEWIKMSPSVGYAISIATLIQFIRRMVAVRQLAPTLDRLLNLLSWVQFALPLGLVLAYGHFVKPATYIGAAASLLILITGLVCAWKKDRSALFFLAAFAVLALSSVAGALRALDYLPTTILTGPNAMQFGSALQMLLLAFALADRFDILRRENARTQQAAIQAQQAAITAQAEALTSKQALVESLEASERVLEERVRHRTEALLLSNSALEEAIQAANSANRAKSAFLATVSHEIRTPLNGILGMAQLLMHPATRDTDQASYAKVILDSGRNLLKLLNDILDFSKVEAGKIEIVRDAVDPGQIVLDVAALFAESAHAKGLHLEFDTSALESGPQIPASETPAPQQLAQQHTAPRHYLSDPTRLRQMLSNLVGNAIKFTPAGKVMIRVREIERRGNQALLEFSVTDTGIGIPQAQHDKLFQPFVQADSSTTREYGGTGLGLSIVRQISELMGGGAGMESEEGKGSCFWFRIPVECVDPDAASGDAV